MPVLNRERRYTMFLLICMCYVVLVFAKFEVPDALIEPLYPKGFRVSIPDQEGIKLFSFHGKLNEKLNEREAGTFSRDVTSPQNGRWTFYDPSTKLKVGDILYYWTYMDYVDGKHKLGITSDDQVFEVKELINDPGKLKVTSRGGMSSSCQSSTVTNVGKVCEGDLIFNSDLKTDIYRKLWTVEQKFAAEPDFEFVMYQNRPETLQAKRKVLRIQPVLSEDLFGSGFITSSDGYDFKENCTSEQGSYRCKQRPIGIFILPPVVSSQISTRHTFSFKYGKIEIRAKLPKGDWIYPEFYLNPLNQEYGKNYDSGQIRLAFTPGNENESTILYGGVILGESETTKNYGMKSLKKEKSWCDDFHKFIVTWKPGSISVGVDNVTYGNIYPPENGFISLDPSLSTNNTEENWKRGSKLAPFDKEMYLTVGVGVGGFNFEDKANSRKPWINKERRSLKNFYEARDVWYNTWNENSALEIDYVKVWAV